MSMRTWPGHTDGRHGWSGVGATLGLLIKGGHVLENMQAVQAIIFDKTGTLTSGKAVLAQRFEFINNATTTYYYQWENNDNNNE
jgi:cation transport ATPase